MRSWADIAERETNDVTQTCKKEQLETEWKCFSTKKELTAAKDETEVLEMKCVGGEHTLTQKG